MERDRHIFKDKTPEQLRVIASQCFILATEANDPLERLVCLQHSSEALQIAGLTVESLGLKMGDIIKAAKIPSSISERDKLAMHLISFKIIYSFPRVRV